MGSLEDLFVRVEKAGNTNYNQIVNWLSDDGKRNKSSYANVGAILAEPFGIREEIEKATEYSEVAKLKREAQSASVKDQKTIKMAQDKMDALSKELAAITERNKRQMEKEAKEAKKAAGEAKRKEEQAAAKLKREAEEREQDQLKSRRNENLLEQRRVRTEITRLAQSLPPEERQEALRGLQAELRDLQDNESDIRRKIR